MYIEDEYLALSGIQHFVFCPRQWALIHIEQQWKENLLTVEGGFLHERVHTETATKAGNISRGMAVFSHELGIYGVCDAVEFHEDCEGIAITGRRGKFLPVPVEYKRGRPKEHDADVLQLCAQAICLEEMLLCHIEKGYLFYGETRRRMEAVFSEQLRQRVTNSFAEMHRLYARGHTPKVKRSKQCGACSLEDFCMPNLGKNKSAKDYIDIKLREDEPCESY